MEKVKVFWKPGAISQLKKQAEWYDTNMGTSVADKFWNGMIAAGDLLSTNPYLGKIEPVLEDSAKLTNHWFTTKIIRSSILLKTIIKSKLFRYGIVAKPHQRFSRFPFAEN